MARFRALVTDLDGTFWHGPEVIHPRIRAAWDEVVGAGVEILIATGRRLQSTVRGTQQAGIEASAVLMSGAVGADLATGREWHRCGFAPDVAKAVLATFRDHDLEPVAYVGRNDVEAVASPGCASNLDHITSFGEELQIRDPDELAAQGVLVGFGIVGTEDEALVHIAEALEGVAPAWLGPDFTYGGRTLMVGPPGVSKVSGIEVWCAQRGIDRSEVLAVGDGSNDVEMLAWAGTSVAVRGGVTEIVGADHVIDGPELAGWASLLDLI